MNKEKLVKKIIDDLIDEALEEKEFNRLSDVIVTKDQQDELINLILYIIGTISNLAGE